MAKFFGCPIRGKRGKGDKKAEIRTVRVGKENSSRYPSNRITTSKYTLWNFLPKNLLEQFRRIANFYFLTITIISFVVESPVGPITSLLPLMFVVLVSGIKQGYEDFVRHRSDRELNNSVVWVLRNSCLQKIPSKKIRVGDIVKVSENEDVPCDLVLLTSSHEASKCYVTTSSLDGETNVKTLYCPKSLKRTIRTENLRYLDATIECENPTPDLFKFNGRIEFSKVTSDLIKRNSLRRQTSLLKAERLSRLTGRAAAERVRSLNPQSEEANFFADGGALLPQPADLSSLSCSSNGDLCPGMSKSSLSSAGEDRALRRLRNTLESLPTTDSQLDLGASQTRNLNSSSPHLGSEALHSAVFRKCLTHSKSEPRGHLTLPKRSIMKHKKSYSNVTNLSWDPAFFDSLENLKWMKKRRGSEKDKLVDPLTAENLLLKGSTLKNTEFVYGCAVYTGQETKMALNSKLTTLKYSVAEKSINKFLAFQLALLLLESIASTILNATIEVRYGRKRFKTIFIEDEESPSRGTFVAIFRDLFLFTMAYNYLVPISLYVTLEMTKFFGALLFKWDLSIYDEASDQSALCNTSDLNEELGMVEILFTDKTGTLTENNLRLHSCSIDGVVYEERDGELFRMESDGSLCGCPVPVDLDTCPTEMQLFLLALTLCNTVQVIVESEGEPFRYSGTSPDEKALVEAMQRMNIVFANEDDVVVINEGGRNRVYQKLEVLEFSSSRKRMSVIVKDEEESIRLYCKGAESAVIPKVKSGPTEETLEHVSKFATKGLRTLVVGYKALTEDEYNYIEERVQKARETLSSDREEVLARTYEEVEDGLILLGATGVEDKLQEGVEDTLRSLRAAGIRVWMLTGDKVETAVNISLSCGHFRPGIKSLNLLEIDSGKDCEEVLQDLHSTLTDNEGEEFGLVADGKSLTHALANCSTLFREVCMKCSAVVCCRLSPIQKSQVVNLVKDRKNAPIVAAIGDGANDVSMLKEAHIGLGIMGKEGRQAVLCSDFAFAKFRFLKKALFVHGHWYYVRTANLVQYFFYKNIVFITPQFYFFFFSGYSVQQLYESIFYICYNTLFTSLPILVYGVFEQNYPKETLLTSPRLYSIHRRNVLMTWKFFALWLALGVWHSLVVFFAPTFFYQISPSAELAACLDNYGTTILHNAVIVVNLKLLLHSRFWSVAVIGSILLSIMIMFLVTIIYSSIYLPDINPSFHSSYNHLLQTPNYWLLCILIWVIALIPDILLYVYFSFKLRGPQYSAPVTKSSASNGHALQESVF